MNNVDRIIQANQRGHMATVTPAQVAVPAKWIKTGHAPTETDKLGCDVWLGNYHYNKGGFYRNFRAALYDNGDHFLSLSIFAIAKTLRDFTTSCTYRYDWSKVEFVGMSGVVRFAITESYSRHHTQFFDTTLRLIDFHGEVNATIEQVGVDKYKMTAKDLARPWHGNYVEMLEKVSER